MPSAVNPVREEIEPSRWWRPKPFELGGVEMLIMRARFALLAYANIKWETGAYTEQKFPNGLAHFFDLTWLGRHPPGMLLQGVTAGCLLFYVLGFAPALGLLPTVFFATAIGTLLNSQGAINHSWQLVTMMGLAQFFVYAWPRRQGVRRAFAVVLRPDLERHRQAAHGALVVIAASYVVCGLMKVINSDGLWLHKAPYLAVQLNKTHFAHYYDTLVRPPQWLQDITDLLLAHPNLARLVFGSGLLIELAAFVVLINRRWALVGGLAIIAMHVSISRLMNLNFEAHIYAALIFCVNLPGLGKAWRGEG